MNFIPLIYRLLPYFLIIFFSCRSENDLKLIPQNAKAVIIIDFKNMALNTLSLRGLFENMTKEDAQSKTKSKNLRFDKTGIDYLKQLIMFQLNEDPLPDSYYLVVPISDKDDFFTFIKSVDSTAKISNSHDVDWITGSSFSFGIKGNTSIGLYSPFFDDAKSQTFIHKLFEAGPEQQLLNASEHFKELVSESYDAAFWADAARQSDLNLGRAGMDTPTGEITGILDFRDGKIDVSGHFFSSDSSESKFASIFNKPIEEGFLQTIPESNPIGILAIRMDMPSLEDFLSQRDELSTSFQGLSVLGISVDELFGAFGGQMAVAIQEPAPAGESLPKLALVLSLTEKAKAEAILQKVALFGAVSKEADDIYTIPQWSGFIIHLTDQSLLVSNSNLLGEEHFDAKKTAAFKTGSILAYANLKEVPKLSSELKNVNELGIISTYWDAVNISSSMVSEKKLDYQITILSSQPTKNALQTGSEFITAFNESKQRDPLNSAGFAIDSTEKSTYK